MWSPQIAYIEQHNATTEFSSTQGSSNWYYKEYTGGTLASTGMINNMTWDAGAGRWIGSSTYSLVGNNWQHPDASNQSVRVYKAPKDGFIEVKSNGNVRLQAAGSDGVYVQVKNNNTVVWPSGGGYGGGWSLITDTSGVAMSFVTYVNKGDEISFVVDKNSSISNDTILLEPIITFIQ